MAWALVASLLLHAGMMALLTALLPVPAPSPGRDTAALDVRLREPPAPRPPEPAAPVPRLMLPKESFPNASAARPAPAVPAAPASPKGLTGAAARIAYQQLQHALLYPREAIEQGIEGEATVLLFLDEAGNAIAARLEASSGHALLDEAAVRAARSLRSLPEAAPREALLPVRFRLRQ